MANHISDIRKKAGYMSAKEAAMELKCSMSMLYYIETGRRKPSHKLASKMVKIFKCSYDDIFLPFITTISNDEFSKNTI